MQHSFDHPNSPIFPPPPAPLSPSQSLNIAALALVVEDPIIQFKDPDKTLLRQAIATQDLKATITHLRRYVPFRLIIPFLEADLGQVSRGKGNQLDVAMPAIAVLIPIAFDSGFF